MTKISESTNVTFDLKTIGLIVGGAISIALTFFTLQSGVAQNKKQIEELKDSSVNSTEFKYKDELIRSTILRINEQQDFIVEDINEVKEQLKKIDERLFDLKSD
tara:strand:+ start:329 stop:640 length:312 start_codon:yes stop_codon:yes gene_type:complete